MTRKLQDNDGKIIYHMCAAVADYKREKSRSSVAMGDEGFDPCECMRHHLSIQHLLSILRQSQDYCTDTECFNVSRLPEPQAVQESPNFFLNICLIFGAIILMYALRPRSLQQLSSDVIKRHGNDPDSRQDPPSPPPTH